MKIPFVRVAYLSFGRVVISMVVELVYAVSQSNWDGGFMEVGYPRPVRLVMDERVSSLCTVTRLNKIPFSGAA